MEVTMWSRLVVLFSMAPAVAAAQVSSITVVPPRATAVAGEQVTFKVEAKDVSGAAVDPGTIRWFLGPFEIASVDQQGIVRTHRQGSARVIVSAGGKSAAADLTILPKPPVRVEVSAEQRDVVVGGFTLVRGVAVTEDGEPLRDRAISYESADPRVATVDASGTVSARAPGEVVIRASSGGAKGETLVRVSTTRVARLQVSGPASGATGDVSLFSARAWDAQGRAVENPPVRWSVTSGGAEMYSDGAFVAAQPGVYTVTATVGTISGAAAIAVRQRTHEWTFEKVSSVIFTNLQAAELWAIGDVLYVSTAADRVYAFDITDPGTPKLTDSLMVDARLVNDVSTTSDGKIGVITRQGASSRRNGIVFLDLVAAASQSPFGIHNDSLWRRAQRVHRRALRLPD
jgi:hypothetical protein